LKNGAAAAIVWEGYDTDYEHHDPRAFGLNRPIIHNFFWGVLGYESRTKTYYARKNFYAIQQVSRFVSPGSWRISVSEPGDSLVVLAFHDPASKKVSIVGINKRRSPIELNGTLVNLPAMNKFEMYYTDNTKNVHSETDVKVKSKAFNTTIPADCIFTLSGI
jgi:O-glycosyl hydrolase